MPDIFTAAGGLSLDTVYIVVPALLVAVVLAAVWLERWSVPVILVALATGILFGSDVLKLWTFGDVGLTNRVANLALVFILFRGGFSTRREDLRAAALPSLGLATWGVALSAAVTLGVLRGALGWPFERALLLAVIISSTDAAATFSILRRRSVPLRLGSLVEIESATNDPMAIIMTLAAVQSLATGEGLGPRLLLTFLWKLGTAPLIGWLLGRGALWVFNRLTAEDRGYYYVLFLAMVLLTYGLGELAGASGLLAVFTAGFVMGNHPLVHKGGVANFSAALSTIANVGMFLLMGVLVFPHEWAHLWLDGIVLFAVLTFVSRPAAVWLGTPGPRIREIRLPEETVIAMISRGRKVVSPNGNTRLRGWDHVTVLAHAREQDAVRRALLEPFSRAGSRKRRTSSQGA